MTHPPEYVVEMSTQHSSQVTSCIFTSWMWICQNDVYIENAEVLVFIQIGFIISRPVHEHNIVRLLPANLHNRISPLLIQKKESSLCSAVITGDSLVLELRPLWLSLLVWKVHHHLFMSQNRILLFCLSAIASCVRTVEILQCTVNLVESSQYFPLCSRNIKPANEPLKDIKTKTQICYLPNPNLEVPIILHNLQSQRNSDGALHTVSSQPRL